MPAKNRILPSRNSTAVLSIHVSKEELEIINYLVSTGLYINASEVIREAIRRLILRHSLGEEQ